MTQIGKISDEAHLARLVVEHLRRDGWEVFQEVEFGGRRADIVATRLGALQIVETKMSLNLEVLAQAAAWRVTTRIAAVPETRCYGAGRLMAWRVAKWLGVGIWEVGTHGDVDGRVRPGTNPDGISDETRLVAALRPEHKTFAAAGTQGGQFTPYRGTMLRVSEMLGNAPDGLAPSQIVAAMGHGHWATKSGAVAGLIKAFQGAEAGWVEPVPDTTPQRYRIRADAEQSPRHRQNACNVTAALQP